jgi:ribose transport system substrate-binding protein
MKQMLSALVVAGLLALSACQNNPPAPSAGGTTTGGEPASTERLQIAMIPKGTSHVFWKSVEAGAKRAADEFNIDLTWKGPLKEDDRAEQIKVIEDFVAKGVDGIGIAPLDDQALVGPVKEAQSKGIPVIIFDSAIKHDDIVSFVATDNHAAGMKGGEKLAEVMGGKGKVILLRYLPASASTREREDGFLMAAKEAGLEVISDNQYAGATTESAQQKADDLINKFKKGDGVEFAGVFCPNESSTFGMLRALENAGLAGKVKFVGFDSSDPLIEGVKAGKIDGLVVQNPEQMGYLAVKNLYDHIKGKTVEKRIDTGCEIKDAAAFAAKP